VLAIGRIECKRPHQAEGEPSWHRTALHAHLIAPASTDSAQRSFLVVVVVVVET
jgi:hypothetical protein